MWTGILVVLSAIAAMAKALSFQEEGYRGGDIFGEAGLNAVPRIGKRVARHSNPYDAFRFRFNDGPNWFGRNLAGGNAGFRFEGTDTGLRRKYHLRKRMSQAIGLDKERERELAAAKAAEAAEMEMAVAADKSALQVPSVGEDEEEADEDDLLTADEYWREYLNEMARKKVIEKLIQPLVAPPSKASTMVSRHRTPSLPPSIGYPKSFLNMFKQPKVPRD